MNEGNSTKHELGRALQLLMDTSPISGITVGDICSACGMNRKSFYYHFRDKYDLLCWIFYTDYFQELRSHADEDPLVLLLSFLEEHQKFYRAALRDTDINSFSACLRDTLLPIASRFLSLSVLSSEDAAFYSDMCTEALHHCIVRWLQEGCPQPAAHLGRLLQRIPSVLNHD
ncbi:MAG: TetR/AcrR family transcriptional regulator C-terminal domain-containing protein [Clostridia bacterium]|nr:TetR/AcrR family transcriptional regulator C-terminal domain-containing protein [Clostridia bacterium]